MAEHYEVTGQALGAERQADGSYEPTLDVTYRTKATPPVIGTVSVPRSLMSDPTALKATVHAKVMEAVHAHAAVASL